MGYLCIKKKTEDGARIHTNPFSKGMGFLFIGVRTQGESPALGAGYQESSILSTPTTLL